MGDKCIVYLLNSVFQTRWTNVIDLGLLLLCWNLKVKTALHFLSGSITIRSSPFYTSVVAEWVRRSYSTLVDQGYESQVKVNAREET